jgi:glycosyltransferase involved in cell wall biosynthesis
MRVLFMADVPKDPNTGASGTELRTMEALRALGHEIDEVWASDLGRRIRHGNLHYLFELHINYQRRLRQALASRSYDVVHVNQPHGWRAARWLRRRPSPRPVFVHRSHGFEPHVVAALAPWQRFDPDRRSIARRVLSGVISRALERHNGLIAKYADGHIVSSSSDAAFLVDRYRVPKERVAIIPQAATEEFLARPALPMTRERLRRVLYVGQYVFQKAPMIVAEAMRRLAGDFELTWVCAAQHHEMVRALAGGAVRLLPWMDVDALREVYDAHGVFLFPSFYEGFGKVFLEAMSRGLCTVASDIGGAHDVITSGRDGILVPAGDAGAIVDAVRALDLPHAVAMSEAAARTARQYTWTRVARETAAFYERLIGMDA